MKIRVSTAEVAGERAFIEAQWGQKTDRRPAAQVFERVARTRVERQEFSRRYQECHGTPTPVNPFPREFERACQQRFERARQLHREIQATDLMYSIVLGLPTFKPVTDVKPLE